MTPQQEARLLRARAKVLKEEANQLADDDSRDPLGFLGLALDEEAEAMLAVAAELDPPEPQRELRDAEDSCVHFKSGDSPAAGWCGGDGHFRCKECIHFSPNASKVQRL